MPTDLEAVWTVLETEAASAASRSLKVNPVGATVAAGEVLVGVDTEACRYLLIPLQPGEAVAEDRSGSGVQLRRVEADHKDYLAVVCLIPSLNNLFSSLSADILGEALGQPSPARAVAEILMRWKQLLATAASAAVLGEEKLVGLMAELLTLLEVVSRDLRRRVDCWTGPLRSQHDFRAGAHAIEVKASTTREGRVVTISSVDQLEAPEHGTLHLAYHRFAAGHGDGEMTLPSLVQRLVDEGTDATELHRRLGLVGYTAVHDAHYNDRPYRLVERRIYDTTDAFPRIVRSSFAGGAMPAGTLHLSYSIDLTNEPPLPLAAAAAEAVFSDLASAAP